MSIIDQTLLGRHWQKQLQASEVSFKNILWVTHKETKRANKHGDIYCATMYGPLRNCGENNSLFVWEVWKGFPKEEPS